MSAVKNFRATSLCDLTLKSIQLQSNEICSAMKEHCTWLASLFSPNSNKEILFFTSRQKILAHIFRETPVKTRKAHTEYSRGGHSAPTKLRVSQGQGKRTTLRSRLQMSPCLLLFDPNSCLLFLNLM